MLVQEVLFWWGWFYFEAVFSSMPKTFSSLSVWLPLCDQGGTCCSSDGWLTEVVQLSPPSSLICSDKLPLITTTPYVREKICNTSRGDRTLTFIWFKCDMMFNSWNMSKYDCSKHDSALMDGQSSHPLMHSLLCLHVHHPHPIQGSIYL